jgi:hypothetical protein
MVVKTGIFTTTEKAQIQKFLTNYKAVRGVELVHHSAKS